MTKILLFSDLHVHSFPEFGAESRLQDCISVLADVRAYCVEHDIKHAVFGGDMFHRRGVVHTRPYVQVTNELVAFREAGIAFYALNGNHDQEDHDGEVHALQPLMAGGLIIGIGKKGWRNVQIGDGNVSLFAYCDNSDQLVHRIRASVAKRGTDAKFNVGIFHHGFKGARVGSVLEYEVKEPIDARRLRLNKRFDLVFSGHYHTHQQIEGIKRGWYIGSPLEHTRSDRSEERKGFLVVDTDALTFERIALKRPRFIKLQSWKSQPTKKMVAGNFVDVVYKRADSELDAFVESIKKLGARGVNPIPLPKAKQTTRRLNVSPTLAPEKVLKRYVKHRRKDVKKQELKAKTLLAFGLRLMRFANQ